MLPKHTGNPSLNLLRFADTALPLVLEKLESMGSKPDALVAHLFGGANMFPGLDSFVDTIGERNVAAAKQILKGQGIPIRGIDVGGNRGRNVTFFLDSGTIESINSVGHTKQFK
jgi:chemotaxis protein CheD